MTRRVLSCLLMLLVFGLTTLRAEDPPTLTPAQFRQAVEVFMQQPSSTRGQAAAKALAHFIIQSKDVFVVLGGEDMRWLEKKPKHAVTLLSAYAAGSALSQLDSGVVRHDPHGGMIQLFRMYRVLQEKEKGYKVPDVEALLKMHREGKLLAHLAALRQKKKEDF